MWQTPESNVSPSNCDAGRPRAVVRAAATSGTRIAIAPKRRRSASACRSAPGSTSASVDVAELELGPVRVRLAGRAPGRASRRRTSSPRSLSVTGIADEVDALGADHESRPVRRAACSGGAASGRCRRDPRRTPCSRRRCRRSRRRTRRPSPRARRARRRMSSTCRARCAVFCGANSSPNVGRLVDPEARLADPELGVRGLVGPAARACRRRRPAIASSRWTGRRRSRRPSPG